MKTNKQTKTEPNHNKFLIKVKIYENWKKRFMLVWCWCIFREFGEFLVLSTMKQVLLPSHLNNCHVIRLRQLLHDTLWILVPQHNTTGKISTRKG